MNKEVPYPIIFSQNICAKLVLILLISDRILSETTPGDYALGELLNYEFNFFNCYKTIQIVYFILSFDGLCVSENWLISSHCKFMCIKLFTLLTYYDFSGSQIHNNILHFIPEG